MTRREPEPKQYKVILLANPSLSEDAIENAQAMLGNTLELLNSHTLEPGLRFADHVTATLEVAHDLPAVMNRIKREKDVALVIASGFEEKPLWPLAKACKRRNVEFCNAAPIPLDERPTLEEQAEILGDEDPYVVPIRFLTPKEAAARKHQLPGHNIDQALLTEPIAESPEVMEHRVNKTLMLLAIGVMTAHTMQSERWFS